MRARSSIAFIALILILSGCSRVSHPISNDPFPENQFTPDSRTQSASSTRYLWGFWSIAIDPISGAIDIVPMREPALHVNVLKFLEGGTPYLRIDNLIVNGNLIDVDVFLRHPFNGLRQYTGFDVSGIFITDGLRYYPGLDVTAPDASLGDIVLENADGYTRWWNPSEFPSDGTIFSYIDGKLGTKYTGSNLSATINGFKYFADELGANDGLDALSRENRGMFQPGFENVRHYEIQFNPMDLLVFNYAVDASWDLPDPNPPVNVPDDFPPEANKSEPYWIDISIVSNDLFYLNSDNKGGCASILVDAWYWYVADGPRFCEINPDGWSASENMTPIGGDDQKSTYQWDLCAGDWMTSSGSIRALVAAGDSNFTYGVGEIPDELVAAYAFIEIPISGTADAPIVEGINPNNADLGTTVVDAEITGKFFASNALLELLDSAAGTESITVMNLVVNDDTSMTCDLIISDSQTPGPYDVIVTNPDTSLSGELSEGFTVNNPEHPWPAWKQGDLRQGASEYVGYGDSGASGTPKWTYSAPTQGFEGCVIANDGSIYFTIWNCALYAVNPDGTFKWSFSPYTPWVSFCPALDDDGYVYTAMGNSSVNYLYKLNPEDGSVVWSCYLGNVPCYMSTPAIGQDGAIYVSYSTAFSPGKIQRVEPDGTLGWSYNIPSSAYSYLFQLGSAIRPDGKIIATGGTLGKILCFNTDGSIEWEYQHTSWILHTPAVGPEGNVYFNTYLGPAELVALDSDGNYLWEFDFGFYQWACPSVDPITGNIFIGDRSGNFRCFENDGTVLWTRNFPSTGIDGSATIDANGDVYVAIGNQPANPYIGVVKMDGANGDILWQSDDIGYLVTHTPSIGSDGTIYMPGHSDTNALYAWGD